MKRLLVLLVIVLSVHGLSFGQNLQFGLRTGLSFASQSLDDADVISTNSVTTYNISLIVEKPFRNGWYLQSGLGLLGKGVTTIENTQTADYKLTYLDIPVNALYKFNLPTIGKLYLGAGPYLSVGLSGNVQYDNTNNISGEKIEFGNANDYKRLDFGVNFTAGLELNNHLTLNTNYALGLNNIATDDSTDSVNSIKNRVFSIGLGFLF